MRAKPASWVRIPPSPPDPPAHPGVLTDPATTVPSLHPPRCCSGAAWGFSRPSPTVVCSFSAPVAQLDRVPGYEPGGRGFESCRARQSLEGLVFRDQPLFLSNAVGSWGRVRPPHQLGGGAAGVMPHADAPSRHRIRVSSRRRFGRQVLWFSVVASRIPAHADRARVGPRMCATGGRLRSGSARAGPAGVPSHARFVQGLCNSFF